MEIFYYALSGFLMKLSDDAHDKKNNHILGIIAGILCGLCIGYLVINSADAACIFFGILIGTCAAKKINCINHFISSAVFLGMALFFGIPQIGILTLIVCSIAAYIDEIGNDNRWIAQKSRKLEIFFRYRFTLKIVILLLVVLGILESIVPGLDIYGIQYLQAYTFAYFLIFELSYDFAGLTFDGVYNGFYSLFRIFRGVYRSSND